MTVAQEFEHANSQYQKGFKEGSTPLPPARKVAVVTCMDARILPESALGLKVGDAHVIRNAGGRVSEALRSLIISQQLLATTEIVVIHHTDCGMLTFSDVDARGVVTKNLGADKQALVDQIAFLPFTNLEKSVKDDVQFIKDHPLLNGKSVSGYIYEVETGAIKKVV